MSQTGESSQLLYPAEVEELLRTSTLVQYHTVATTSWLIYDLAISIGDEVELVWKSRNSLAKWLYLWARYFGIFMQCCLSLDVFRLFCRAWYMFEAISVSLLIIGVELSLILRTYALYGRNRKVLIILCTLLAVEMTLMCLMAGLGFRELLPHLIPFPSSWTIQGCITTVVPGFYIMSWIPAFIFESLLFAMTMFKFLRFRNDWHHTPILTRFFRDGTVYYAVIFVALLHATISHQVSKRYWAPVAFTWMISIFSYAGSRLLLSLRKLAYLHNGRGKELASEMGFVLDEEANGELNVNPTINDQKPESQDSDIPRDVQKYAPPQVASTSRLPCTDTYRLTERTS